MKDVQSIGDEKERLERQKLSIDDLGNLMYWQRS